MKLHKHYLRDEDDAYDSTYALFHFSIPDDVKNDCLDLIAKGYGVDPAARWAETVEQLRKL